RAIPMPRPRGTGRARAGSWASRRKGTEASAWRTRSRWRTCARSSGSTAATPLSPPSGARSRRVGGAAARGSSRRFPFPPRRPARAGRRPRRIGLSGAFLGGGAAARAEHAARHLRGRRVSYSVVIPTFRRAETLFPVLDALAVQTDPPEFEVVVVDDGSGDDTLSRLRSYPPAYPFRFCTQENAG